MRYRRNGGTHELSNLVCLCRFHHRYVHRNDLALAFDTDGITLLVTTRTAVLRSPPARHFAAAQEHDSRAQKFAR